MKERPNPLIIVFHPQIDEVQLTDLEQPVDRTEAFCFSGVYPFTLSLAGGDSSCGTLVKPPLSWA